MLFKIFLFLSFFVLYNFKILYHIYPEKKLRMKNICAISKSEEFLYLKTRCSKNERCYLTEKDEKINIYQCGKKVYYQKIGEDCGVNEECYTGLCFFGKCSSINNDEDCTVEHKNRKDEENVCNPNHWCYEHDSLNHLYKCVPYVGEGEIYDLIDGKICRIGLKPHKDPITYLDKCTKYGSLEIGELAENKILCQTGFFAGYNEETEEVDDNFPKKCFTVVTDSPCEYDTDDFYCKPIIDGLDKFVVEGRFRCDNFYNIPVCPVSKGKEKCFKEYISILNTINIDEVYGNENKLYSLGYGNNKLTQAFQKYKFYDELFAMGILNENGDVNKHKKDEWEFFWKTENSFLIKFSYYFYLLFFFNLI